MKISYSLLAYFINILSTLKFIRSIPTTVMQRLTLFYVIIISLLFSWIRCDNRWLLNIREQFVQLLLYVNKLGDHAKKKRQLHEYLICSHRGEAWCSLCWKPLSSESFYHAINSGKSQRQTIHYTREPKIWAFECSVLASWRTTENLLLKSRRKFYLASI